MFKKLLVPLDMTNKHDSVIATTADLALRHGATVTLLHVIEAITGLSGDEEKQFYGSLTRAAEKHLEKYTRTLAGRGLAVASKVLVGNRPRDIVAHAAQTGADLIILTAPRFEPAQPTGGWGSLSYKVGVLAQCPVLLVKGSVGV